MNEVGAWTGVEKGLLWSIAYSPVILILLIGTFEKDIIKMINSKVSINAEFLIVIFIIILMCFIYFLGKCLLNFLLKRIDRNIYRGGEGEKYEIRKIKNVSQNNYTFFILTVLLPLIGHDSTSIVQSVVFIIIMFVLIILFIKTGKIETNPILLFSKKYELYEVELSTDLKEKEHENSRFTTVIILKKGTISLNKPMRGKQLAKGFYFLKFDS